MFLLQTKIVKIHSNLRWNNSSNNNNNNNNNNHKATTTTKTTRTTKVQLTKQCFTTGSLWFFPLFSFLVVLTSVGACLSVLATTSGRRDGMLEKKQRRESSRAANGNGRGRGFVERLWWAIREHKPCSILRESYLAGYYHFKGNKPF